jgi:predicted MPP superfamily phosphohydrolase
MWNSKITRRKFLDRVLRIGICSAIGYPIVIEPNWPVLEQVEVAILGLPDRLEGLRIGLLADFHRGYYVTKSDIQAAVDLLQETNPDMVLLAGDYVYGNSANAGSCAAILAELRSPLGTYAVLGNHDYWTNAAVVRNSLEQVQIRVLVNESVQLKLDGHEFFLLGLDDIWEGQPNIHVALSGIPNEAMKILLVHEPDYAENIRRLPIWLPLQLSGHSHGGQVILPLRGPLHLPYLGKRYPMGLQSVSDTCRWVYTTRGVGHTIPVRFNCNPEVTLLTLRAMHLT